MVVIIEIEQKTRGCYTASESVFIPGLVGAAAWITFLAARIATVPTEFWRWRDDAVITLSHAQNLVVSGTIGVSPGGDRVEGFSSPLQFTAAALFFAVTSAGYQVFLDLFVLICMAISGFLAGNLLYRLARNQRVAKRNAYLLTAVLMTVTGSLFFASWTATGWLLSGMENPLVLVCSLGVVTLSSAPRLNLKRAVGIGLLLGLLGISRVEFPVLMIPLIVAVGIVVYLHAPRAQRIISVLLALGIPFLTWGSVHIMRFLYFGQTLPNTAVAQDRSTGTAQIVNLSALTTIALLLVVLFIGRNTVLKVVRSVFWLLSSAITLVFVFLDSKNHFDGNMFSSLVNMPLFPEIAFS